MIQNELLPECAVMIEGKETIWILRDYQVIQILKDIKPIPLTAESVPKIQGFEDITPANHTDKVFIHRLTGIQVIFYDRHNDGAFHLVLTGGGRPVPHKAVHELQQFVKWNSETGTMPKYEIG